MKAILQETDPRHSDMIDAYAYMFAAQEAKCRDEYVLAYVKKKPWWIPKFLFEWLLRKLFVIASFKK